MFPPEGFQRFPCRRHAAFSNVRAPLADAFFRVRLCRNVEQVLIGFGILHDGGVLAVDRQNNRAFRFLELLKEVSGMIPKRGQGLNVSGNIHPVMLRE